MAVLEQGDRLSRSRLWRLQRSFFEQSGLGAWTRGMVPHYITSNVFIADAYAKVARAFFDEHADAPLTIVELGAGTGRFAFQFLARFLPSPRPLTYVMTDFSDGTIAAWREHPQLRALAEEGVLDFARFDAERDRELTLAISGRRISPQQPAAPLLAIANYAFDSIAHDAFQIANGQIYECLSTLTTPEDEPDPPDPEDPKILERIELSYEMRHVEADYYDDPRWNQILRGYQQRLNDTAVGFPVGGLHACDALAALSGGQLLLLTSDKGKVHEQSLHDLGPPRLTVHGSFSLSVNYHAIAELFTASGGQAWYAPHLHSSICTCAFVRDDRPLAATRAAFTAHICDFGPDDWFAAKKSVENRLAEIDIEQLLALIRLSRNDPRFVGQCAIALFPRAAKLGDEHKRELLRVMLIAWELYFPVDEADDLAFALGALALEMGFPREALPFCQRSLDRYGPDPSTLYNIAICHFDLGDLDQAARYTRDTLSLDPGHIHARAMLERLGIP